MTGANRTGRPFTGDFAGVLLYETLLKFGLAEGVYDARPDDGLTLTGAFISNSVHCVPPQNKPDVTEIHACRPFLEAQLRALPNLKVVVALGTIAHQSAVKALGGHATLVRAPAALRAAVDVFQPQDTGLAALSKRVKDSFDPNGVLNPGRMWAGV